MALPVAAAAAQVAAGNSKLAVAKFSAGVHAAVTHAAGAICVG